jgi:Flp pilus assembly protein TadG
MRREETATATMREIARAFARAGRSVEGAEIAEAALVLPLVFMLLLGIVWFGRAFNIYSTIQQAAQQGAIVAARPTCASCGNDLSGNVVVSNAVVSVLKASSIDPDQILATSPSPGLLTCPSPAPTGTCTMSNNIWVCQSVQLNFSVNATQVPQCGTVVSFQYPFKFYLPFTSLNMQSITMTARAQSRMEN